MVRRETHTSRSLLVTDLDCPHLAARAEVIGACGRGHGAARGQARRWLALISWPRHMYFSASTHSIAARLPAVSASATEAPAVQHAEGLVRMRGHRHGRAQVVRADLGHADAQMSGQRLAAALVEELRACAGDCQMLMRASLAVCAVAICTRVRLNGGGRAMSDFCFPPPGVRRASPWPAPRRASRCTASTASAATTPTTCARWATTRARAAGLLHEARRCARRQRREPCRIRRGTANLHHEIELVVAIGIAGGAPDRRRSGALAHVFGYAAGNDLTRRDLQSVARERGQPWDTAKGFDCLRAAGGAASRGERPLRARGASGSRSTACCARSRTSAR